MSTRERNKFLFAGFGWISVTRLLSVRSKTEKKAGIFCTKQPLCAVFYGGFLLFEAVRPRNLAAGTKKSGPRKRNSRPRKFFFEPRNSFSRPRFFQTAAWKPFFPLFGTFSPTNPRCQYVGTSPARLTRPGNPGAETARTRDKKKACALYLPTFGFPHVPRACVFCARPRLPPRTSESQGASNDKVSNPRANNKMSNPSQQKVCPSGGKTPPPCRGGGPQGRKGFPCTRVTSPLFPTRLCCPWIRPVLFPWA